MGRADGKTWGDREADRTIVHRSDMAAFIMEADWDCEVGAAVLRVARLADGTVVLQVFDLYDEFVVVECDAGELLRAVNGQANRG